MPKKTVEYEEAKRSGRWLWVVLALLIGALIGWAANESESDKKNRNSGNIASSSSSLDQQNTQEFINLTTVLSGYSHMLIEASREGVDAPSDEAKAAKQALSSKTDTLVKSLNQSGLFKDTNKIKEQLNKVNEAFLAYASTARTEDNQQALDKALADLGLQIKDDAKDIDNLQALLASLSRFKNTVVGSIRNFADNDYQGSYDKQFQAESQTANILEQLN